MTAYTSPQTGLDGSVSMTGVLPGFAIPTHDYIALGYTGGGLLNAVTYKVGGSAGTTVAAFTLAYDGGGNLTSVTKSQP